MEFLKVEGLEKKFGRTEVLKGLDFSLQEGQISVIIGASGCGKTTLLRCLDFLTLADGGRIYLGGEKIFDAKEKYSEGELRKKRLKFGLVFQNFNLFPQYTARGNILLAADLIAKERAGGDKRKLKELTCRNRERADSLLERMGLSDRAEAYPAELSGGQQQRVAIARALAADPEILCFDEPTSALDPALSGEVLKLIRSLNRTAIVVTHEMKFARQVGDYAIYMEGGKIVESGPPEKVFDSPEDPKTRAFLSRREE